MKIGRSLLALDLESLAVNQYRQHIAARQHRVHLNLTTVEPALPAVIVPLQLQSVILVVDGDFVNHRLMALRLSFIDLATFLLEPPASIPIRSPFFLGLCRFPVPTSAQ